MAISALPSAPCTSMNARARPTARPGRTGRRSTARWDKRWRRFRSTRWLPRLPLFPERPRAPLRQNTTSLDTPHDRLDRHPQTVRSLSQEGYKYGFVTDIEADEAPPGLNEDTIRFISAKKEEPVWLLEWRLAAFHAWLKMTQPNWAKLHLTPIDYQAATYYSAPKKSTGPKSLDEVDPELLRTYEKLGIPLREREALAGVAVDAVFDSISVATTFKEE